MAKVYSDKPPVSQTERDVLAILKQKIQQKDWIIINSLQKHYSAKNPDAETDFIVLIPNKGIVVIEVKGATSFKVDENGWVLEGVAKKKRHDNPIEQLAQSELDLRHLIRRSEIVHDYDIPIARILWFAAITVEKGEISSRRSGAAFEDFELKYSNDLKNPEKMLLDHIDRHLEERKRNSNMREKPENFTPEVMNSIFREIFPQFQSSDSLTQLKIIRAKLLKSVELEQSKIIDLIEDNPNIFITGPAGSGKSYLLAQLAMNSAKKGHQVLLTCHGVMMADWLESRIGPNPNIKVVNLGQLMLEYSGKGKHKETNAWYEETLPTLALEAIKKITARAKYSAIVIDEFQDIAANPLKIQFLKSIQTQIVGRKSRFIFAGDDQQQILSDNEFVDSFDIAEKMTGNLTLLKLNQNCRQTPQLAQEVYKFLDRPYPFREDRLRTDLESGLEVISCDETNQARKLLLVTERMRKEFPDNNMRILCFENDKSVLGQIFAKDEIKDSNEKKLAHLFKEKVKNPHGVLRWRSIRKYKGLDDDVVIITDVSKASEEYIARETGKTMLDWLYVGMTRARFKVVLLVQDKLFEPTHNANGTTFVQNVSKGA